MAGKHAILLYDDHVGDLLIFASCTRHPERNRVLVLLSAKAGLRAAEIAGLAWDMLVDPTGKLGPAIELHDHAAKNQNGRRTPILPDLAMRWCPGRPLTDGCTDGSWAMGS
jgi:integrase/recombinase XerD